MKIKLILLLIALFFLAGCDNKRGGVNGITGPSDNVTVPDYPNSCNGLAVVGGAFSKLDYHHIIFARIVNVGPNPNYSIYLHPAGYSHVFDTSSEKGDECWRLAVRTETNGEKYWFEYVELTEQNGRERKIFINFIEKNETSRIIVVSAAIIE